MSQDALPCLALPCLACQTVQKSGKLEALKFYESRFWTNTSYCCAALLLLEKWQGD